MANLEGFYVGAALYQCNKQIKRNYKDSIIQRNQSPEPECTQIYL